MCDARSSFGDMKRSSRIIYTCCNLVGDRFWENRTHSGICTSISPLTAWWFDSHRRSRLYRCTEYSVLL